MDLRSEIEPHNILKAKSGNLLVLYVETFGREDHQNFNVQTNLQYSWYLTMFPRILKVLSNFKKT